jgi:hypothetical protein
MLAVPRKPKNQRPKPTVSPHTGPDCLSVRAYPHAGAPARARENIEEFGAEKLYVITRKDPPARPLRKKSATSLVGALFVLLGVHRRRRLLANADAIRGVSCATESRDRSASAGVASLARLTGGASDARQSDICPEQALAHRGDIKFEDHVRIRRATAAFKTDQEPATVHMSLYLPRACS